VIGGTLGFKIASFLSLRSHSSLITENSSNLDLRLYNAEFSVIDETDDFIVVDKPAHLMVHPSGPGNPPTLWDGLQELLVFELATGGQVSIITRLDRETSGVVLVAKTKAAARQFGFAMERGEFEKTYQAIVWGWPVEDRFVIDGPLIRRGEIEESAIWVKQVVHPDGKPSRTEMTVLTRFERETTNGDRFALVECRPLSGRMHQIRVHLQHAGHPIVGDKLYGPDETCYLRMIEDGWQPALAEKLLLDRQALHANCLAWRAHRWEAPLPAELAAFAAASENHSS